MRSLLATTRESPRVQQRRPNAAKNKFIKYIQGEKQDKLQSCSLWNKNHIHSKTDKMKRQRAMYQMKEQDKTPEKQLNEVEIGNLPEKEFRIIIVKMIQDLRKTTKTKFYQGFLEIF